MSVGGYDDVINDQRVTKGQKNAARVAFERRHVMVSGMVSEATKTAVTEAQMARMGKRQNNEKTSLFHTLDHF